MNAVSGSPQVLTLTLNPALDWTLTVPGFSAGAVNRIAAHQYDAGGKGLNVASRLAAMGQSIAVTGILGEANDEVFARHFEQLGMVDHCVRVSGETRTNVKVVNPDTREVTDLNQSGPAISADALSALEEVLFSGPVPQWYVLAGSLPAGVSTDIYQHWIPRLQARGARVALDASGEALRAGAQAGPDLIKPNHHELAELTGTATDSLEQCLAGARQQVAAGTGMVVVSMGAEGALFVTRERALHAVPGPVSIQTTVGAGDAMVAGVINASLEGLGLAELARMATGFSMNALASVGARTFNRERLQSFAASVSLHEL